MAPSNRRIVTLHDLESGGGGRPSVDAREEERMMIHRGPQNSEPARKPTPPPPASASGPYCQPTNSSMASSSSSSSSSPITIPLYHLPSLPMADVCRTTLERILKEFQPIIQRRRFRVKSISEFCCCGDGLDETSRRKRPKQGDSVWGYNQTTTWGSRSRGAGGASKKNMSHTIHLRLREPKKHTTQLLTWEFVAGTMAHELSHCVHQNHSPAFYKLMEELLDEHATLQLEQMGNIIYGGNGGTTTPATAGLPTSGGQRLGGGGGGGASKSRLLQEPLAGKRLSNNTVQRPPLTPQARREAMAQAAERRQRQMARLRHVIERSKEPCVIELLDDDDDDDDDEEDGQHYRNRRRLDQKPAAVVGSATSQEPDLVDLTDSVPRHTKKAKAWNNAVVDLTTGSSTPSPHTRTTRGRPAASFDVVEGEESSTIKEWICDRCTVLNRPLALVCEVCLSERKKESNDGIIELH